jgi:hypothetical protein
MAAVGGSIASVSIDSVDYAVAADADVALKMGGTKVTARRSGSGATRYTGEEEDWSLSGIEVSIDLGRNDVEPLDYLQRVADALEAVPCTITLIDGTVYSGMGLVVDDHDYSTAKATAGLTLMGQGKLTRQFSTF